jgi:invasion protein IalB
MRIIPLLIVLGSLPAVAAGTGPEAPDAPAPVAAPAAPVTEPAAVSPAPAANAVAAPAAAAPVAASAAEEFRPPSGYKKKTRDGRQVYCRNETPVGTRFPTEYCFTQVDLERMEKNKRSIQMDHSTRTKMCSTGAGCGGG